MLMHRNNEVQCQSHDIGMARISECGVRSQVVPKGKSWMVQEQSDMHFMKIIPGNISHGYVITFQMPEQ